MIMEENMNKASAPKAENEGVYHLQLKPGDVPPYVILPGAPERTLKIARNWEDVKEVASYREYKTVTGKYKGMDMACTSTGIGGPSSEICLHELNTLGVHTCIRVGTTGCIVPQFDLGDLIIPVACVRKDGTSATYVEPEFPAFANTYVVMALMEACERLGFRYGLGLDYTVGSFYIGQGRPLNEDGSGYWPSFAEKIIPDLQTAGVTNIEMETSGQFVVGYLHEMRMGAILSVISNRVLDRWGDNGGEEKACLAAAEAMKILKEWDETGEVKLSVKKNQV
ncbi:uridine phosphorylase [Faecalicatena contorta]